MVALVLEDPREDGQLLVSLRELDQPPVRELRGRLERDVQVAVALERLVAELGLERGRHAAHRAGREHEQAGRTRAQRRPPRVQEVAGRRHPAREHALDLAPVDDERREALPAGEQRAADVRRVQLLVLPDPYERLADERPDLGRKVQRVDTRRRPPLRGTPPRRSAHARGRAARAARAPPPGRRRTRSATGRAASRLLRAGRPRDHPRRTCSTSARSRVRKGCV